MDWREATCHIVFPPPPEINPDRGTSLIEKKKEDKVVMKQKTHTAPHVFPTLNVLTLFFHSSSCFPLAHSLIKYLALVFWHCLFGDCCAEREKGYELLL